MGAHPRGSSTLVRSGHRVALADVIAQDGRGALGPRVSSAFAGRLPFLLKVLAAAEPLSLQAHPSLEQARAGFDDEERRGVPLDAAHRNYKDPNHKPELICALTPFDALCGFRRIEDTRRLFDALNTPALAPALAPLRSADASQALAQTLRNLMTLREPLLGEVLAQTLAACRSHVGPFRAECDLALKLSQLYPGDPGIVTALLLNLVHLEPGEAIYLGAGNLHAYLDGVGVEIMASSDNVLRGGLTPKHVDVDELLRVLIFVDDPVSPLRARAMDTHEDTWDTPAPEFRLSRIRVDGPPVARVAAGPEILLCTEGAVDLADDRSPTPIRVQKGCSAFVAGDTAYSLSGHGVAFRASVGRVPA